MRRVLLTMLLSILLTPAALAETDAAAPSISPEELQARRDAGEAPLVIDVRTKGEYESGHIPGALNIPFEQVAEQITQLDTPHGVALYCMVGPRARKGEAALLSAGYDSVFHIEGGLAAWQAAGLPVSAKASAVETQ